MSNKENDHREYIEYRREIFEIDEKSSAREGEKYDEIVEV